MRSYLKKIGYNPDKIQIIPFSGFCGDNTQKHSMNKSLFKGNTLIGSVPDRCVDIVILRTGQVVRVASAMIISECKTVEMHNEALTQAVLGDNIRFNLKGVSVKDIKRGFVC
ncbi:MAG: putative translation elongation factor-1 alpha, partial [Streblomastix strix]